MFGWLFRNAVADPQEQGTRDWQTTPTAPPPPCTCTECQKARAALLVDTGRYPGVSPRSTDVTWATDPTVYQG